MKCVLLKNQHFKCPYLKGNTARHENVLVKEMAEDELETLLKLGFRHFGEYFFRPMCYSCHCCIPIRIPVEKFVPSKSVKRLFSRNKQFTSDLMKPTPSPTLLRLYKIHKRRFNEVSIESYDQFCQSFFHPFSFNRMLVISDKSKIITVSHLDVTSQVMSAVYCYYDEDYERYSLGTYAIYKEIELARDLGIKWFYLGYYVQKNLHMNYKLRFKPNQLLLEENLWIDYLDSAGNINSPNALTHGFTPRIFPFSGKD